MALSSAYPNPFNPSTTFGLDIPQTVFFTVDVFDMLGVAWPSSTMVIWQPARIHCVSRLTTFRAGCTWCGQPVESMDAGFV
ncbi:MAG: hypothetical protein IH855_03490 [Bacteroidetes bacterium]|nr:hypothetical protein [Bacteroidota bacterium]